MRDVRLDFFRGLALVFIFLNHVGGNVASWLTNRNFGFSDATEIFVFVSGYSAVIAYGAIMQRHGYAVAAARMIHRIWQLYVAHIFLFVVFSAQIAYVATRFDNPMYTEEMNLLGLLNDPYVNLIQALVLKFKPANMDVLPLYIVLLIAFLPILFSMMRWPRATLVSAVMLYFVARYAGWNLPSYPQGQNWVFNPFCWQLVFVLGAWCGLRRDSMVRVAPYNRILLPMSVAYLIFALWIAMSWRFVTLENLVPGWLEQAMYPISKPNLDPLRLVHFAALAYVTLWLCPPSSPILQQRAAQPLIQLGRHGLQVFCLGVFLSFTAHFILVESGGGPLLQLLVSAVGVFLLWVLAAVLEWYRDASGQRNKTVKVDRVSS